MHWRGWPACCNLREHLPLNDNQNLLVALRQAFPADLDADRHLMQ